MKTDTAETLAPIAEPPRTINIEPTWSDLVNVLVVLIENGTPEGRARAIDEMRRMAAAADEAVAARRAAEKGGN